MRKRMLTIGMFLLGLVLFIGAIGLTAEAGIVVDDTNKEIELSAGSYTLDDIWANASVGNDNLTNHTDGTWTANFSFVVEDDATLLLNPTDGETGCTWLRLARKNESGKFNSHIDVQGKLYVNDTTITGWNNTGNCNQTWNGTFRPYIYILPTAHTDSPWASFMNSTIGYLGYDIDNKYGIVYEDDLLESNDTDSQGWIHNCTVLENFIGVAFQGCANMNVTDSYFNNTKEVGIVYTTGGVIASGAHNGYVGDNLNTSLADGQYDGVTIVDCYGDATAMGIRLASSNNITFDDVTIINATTEGLYVSSCDNLNANNTLVYQCTNAADDYNIYLLPGSDNCTFTNSTAHTPDGAADGGNWHISGGDYNTFSYCYGYLSSAHEDFYVEDGYHNTFEYCTANNSDGGFLFETTNNNTVDNCTAHNHTTYEYKILGSQYNTMRDDDARDGAMGLYLIDVFDTDISHHNTISRWAIVSATSYGICVGSDGGADNICHNNTISNVTVNGTTTGDGLYLFDHVRDNRVENTTIISCAHANADGFALADYANNNTFVDCNSTLNGDSGYLISEDSNHNTLSRCVAYNGPDDGIEVNGDPHNNTISDCNFNNNEWGIFMWPAADSRCRDNTFNNCTFNSNAYDGIDIGRAPINYFYDCSVYNNSVYGVDIDTNAVGYFFNCIVDNPTTSNYDWHIGTTADVDIYSPYILGFDMLINYQFDTVQPYGLVAHDVGDGTWNLNTTNMIVYCQADNNSYINLTTWTSSPERVQWIANASSGTILYQKIGGLTAGQRYDLKVGGSIQSTNYSGNDTMLPTHGVTPCIWFNYSGGWSNKTFTLERHSAPADEGGAAPQEEEEPTPEQDSDGDGWSDAAELAAGTNPYDATDYPGAPPAFLGLWWWQWLGLAIAAAGVAVFFTFVVMPLAMPVYWKKFKKLFKFK